MVTFFANAHADEQVVDGPYSVDKSGAVLPNATITPGKVREGATAEEICAKGFTTKKYRHTTSTMKRTVYKNYSTGPNDGLCKSGCEVDHLIPLTLAGADDVANLWPQPAEPTPGFHQKDTLEVRLHSLLCRGLLTLPEAQQCIANNWYSCWLRYVKSR